MGVIVKTRTCGDLQGMENSAKRDAICDRNQKI